MTPSSCELSGTVRYLEASVRHPPPDRHPMHEFAVTTDGYGVTRLLYRDQYTDTEQAALFHVEGACWS